MTNVWILVGLALKRDRVMIPAWLLGLAAAVAVTASSYSSLYATEASRREVVQTLGTTPATLALYGRIYADSVGGLVAWRVGGIALALAGLMAILIVVRHTRAEEETGRAELIGAGVVGRNAPLAAALITAGLTSLALGGCVVLALVATGLGLTGSLALGASFAAVGLVFAATAAVTAQVAESARGANGLAVGVLGAAFALRAIGDAGPHWVAWLSPLGWGQALRPFADERWWVLLLLLALAAALTAAAVQLAAHRDLGAGIIPPRPGPARGELSTPLQLAWRLQRGALAGWAAGFAILGAAFGSIAQDIGNVIGDSPDGARRAQAPRRQSDARRHLPRRDLRRARADRGGLRGPGDPAPARRGDERPRRAAARHLGLTHALGAQPHRDRARRHRGPARRRGPHRRASPTPPRPATRHRSRGSSPRRWPRHPPPG